MKITDLLAKESILLNALPKDKMDSIDQIVKLMVKSGNIADPDEYKAVVLKREGEGTTGIGDGVAIPHGKTSSVKKPGLAAMTIPQGIDFEALDDQPVKLIFLIAAPEESNVHLEILGKLAVLLMDTEFVNNLVACKDKDEFLEIIDRAELAKDATATKEKPKISKDKKEPISGKKFFIAVTGCPTGIAHTYMAAEALEKQAAEMGYEIKVETRGSGGAKNVLTDDEIKRAEGVIVAADTQVPMARFDGKKLVQTKVSDGISKPKELIENVMTASPYKASEKDKNTSSGDSEAHTIYKHLMNGVSHMLPFVVGGGILIALSFLIDGLLVESAILSSDAASNFGSITPLARMFKSIGGASFGFMLPVLAGFIAMSIADRPGLAVGIVGGFIAANGTSGFLGALAAGFIAGYIVKLLKKLTEKLPSAIDGIRPILIYPVFGILLIGLVMQFAIEPIIGSLNIGLNNWLNGMQTVSAVILGLILGGMMAIDMGGPFNKAAYVFGTASIASGNFNIMAAVMVGGMTPPIAIALASLIFKNKFTENQRKTAPANIIMGLSFITEGAIPFAAADPLRVIPACIAGSAVAGGLSMLFNCTLMAPHGGIFVFPVVGNALMYLVALAAGTAVSTALLGILKKDIK